MTNITKYDLDSIIKSALKESDERNNPSTSIELTNTETGNKTTVSADSSTITIDQSVDGFTTTFEVLTSKNSLDVLTYILKNKDKFSAVVGKNVVDLVDIRLTGGSIFIAVEFEGLYHRR